MYQFKIEILNILQKPIIINKQTKMDNTFDCILDSGRIIINCVYLVALIPIFITVDIVERIIPFND